MRTLGRLALACSSIALLVAPLHAQTATGVTLSIGQEDGAAVDPTVIVAPGESGSIEFFYASEVASLQGMALNIAFESSVTILGDFDIAGTIVEAVGAEFVVTNTVLDPTVSIATLVAVGILLDSLPPFEAQTLPPSSQPLMIGSLQFSAGNATGDVTVSYESGLLIPPGSTTPLDTIVAIDNEELLPETTIDGTISIRRSFVRSDCNGDGIGNVADPIYLLSHLFSGGATPPCFEACEMNVDGSIDLGDAIAMVNFLFVQGAVPPAPYPLCGTVPGSIDCASSPGCP